MSLTVALSSFGMGAPVGLLIVGVLRAPLLKFLVVVIASLVAYLGSIAVPGYWADRADQRRARDQADVARIEAKIALLQEADGRLLGDIEGHGEALNGLVTAVKEVAKRARQPEPVLPKVPRVRAAP